MKILYSIAGTYNSGGMERVLANKANWLVAHGHEVIIVTTDQRGESPYFPLDARIKCYDLAINYEENNGKSFLNKLIHYPFKQWKHKRRLTALLKELKPDVVISMFCNDASFIPSIKDGSKKILEIHFSRFKRLQYGRKGLWRLADWWRYKTDAKVVSRFDKFVVLTHEDKEYWGNLRNMCVIPNARTFEVSQSATLEAKKVVAVGRLNHQKGFDRLIDAWSIVDNVVSGWKLQIVGDGELRELLQNNIRELGLSNQINIGRAEKDMVSVYKDASILAMSSRYEGLPMVLLEAQAAGLPIVSFDCKCGPKDVIENGVDGFLVEDGDIEQLAQKLVVLMQDANLRKQMGSAAYAHSERYSEERIMKQWIDLFDEVMEGQE
ncbi:MAG: glycosyltransferase family 4 protein [Bacteroidaceae bacterium]|nr:glycosyltransferase family 4 protein [Bacteroidaceae bacterium]